MSLPFLWKFLKNNHLYSQGQGPSWQAPPGNLGPNSWDLATKLFAPISAFGQQDQPDGVFAERFPFDSECRQIAPYHPRANENQNTQPTLVTAH